VAAKGLERSESRLTSPDSYLRGMSEIETIDSELRLVSALRRATRERGGPLPLLLR
jgi:hypothetical protein